MTLVLLERDFEERSLIIASDQFCHLVEYNAERETGSRTDEIRMK